jgi:hypothetical protein
MASASSRRAFKYLVFVAVLIALVVVPFLLFGAELEAWALRVMADDRSKAAVAAAGGLLLASDVVLPIPSTVVISALGALLGGVLGTAIAVIGLTLSCVTLVALGTVGVVACYQEEILLFLAWMAAFSLIALIWGALTESETRFRFWIWLNLASAIAFWRTGIL